MQKYKSFITGFFILIIVNQIIAGNISEKSLERIQEKVNKADQVRSTSSKRREYKNIIRSSQSLLKRNKDAENRFELLALIIDCQKKQLNFEDNDRLQKDFIKTCKALLEAPKAYAHLKVEADSVFLQFNISQEDKTEKQKAMEIAKFADRYGDTSAEADSLMIAADLSYSLGFKMLYQGLRNKLENKFSHNPLVIAFLHQRFAVKSDILFHGKFKRYDGKEVSFPIGSNYIICFWSKDAPLLEEKLDQLKKTQKGLKGRIKIYSFNLDERSDAGRRVLDEKKLDWIPLQLPQGKNNPLYKSIGISNDFHTLLVNPYGLSKVQHMGYGKTIEIPFNKKVENALKTSDTLPLLHYLSNGEFLIHNPLEPFNARHPPELKSYNKIKKSYHGPSIIFNKESISIDEIEKIQHLFIDYPKRLFTNQEKVLNNFIQIEKLCDQLIEKFPNAPNRWVVHNRRIVSLIGQWRIKGEYELLQKAHGSANEVISMNCPPKAKFISYFLEATEQMSLNRLNARQAISELIRKSSRYENSGRVNAAAFVLAMGSYQESLYHTYKAKLIKQHNDPSSWPLSSFLLDGTTLDQFITGAFKKIRQKDNMNLNSSQKSFFQKSFSTINEQNIQVPASKPNCISVLVFIDGRSHNNHDSMTKNIFNHLQQKKNKRSMKDLEVIAVFMGGKKTFIQNFIKKNHWDFQIVHLNQKHVKPIAKELGLSTLNHHVNVSIIGEQGQYMLSLSGLNSSTQNFQNLTRRIDSILEQRDLKLAMNECENKNYTTLIERLKISYPLKNRQLRRHEQAWEAPNEHRRRLIWAYMQTEQWDEALKLVNLNIKAHHVLHNHPYHRGHKWCGICYNPLNGIFTRATLLKKLGKVKEAERIIKEANFPICPKGNDLTVILENAESFIESRIKRYRHYKDLNLLLKDHDKSIRASRQSLYTYKLENDHLLRAKIYQKMNQSEKAKTDFNAAKYLSWPFKTRVYDLNHSYLASVYRRKLAKTYIDQKNWDKVIELTSQNIQIHESEALRCNSKCKICENQIISFRLRAELLKQFGREEEAEWSLIMAAAAKCSNHNFEETFKAFPYNRMNAAGAGKFKLDFIEEHMKGNIAAYAYSDLIEARLELAEDLIMRAKALEQSGFKDKAKQDHLRAKALRYPHDSIENDKVKEYKFVDMVMNID